MTPLDRSLDFCMRLARAHASLVRRLDGQLGALHGLSFGDFAVLLEISRAPTGRLRRVDLAECLGLTASAVTRMLIPLEKIGLVSRQKDKHDARVGYAALTKAGERVLKEAVATAELASREALPSDAGSRLATLSETLAQLGGG
jgi:DNA-binding MarR family transcriptional regulator